MVLPMLQHLVLRRPLVSTHTKNKDTLLHGYRANQDIKSGYASQSTHTQSGLSKRN